jgi:hypothetical protein
VNQSAINGVNIVGKRARVLASKGASRTKEFEVASYSFEVASLTDFCATKRFSKPPPTRMVLTD